MTVVFFLSCLTVFLGREPVWDCVAVPLKHDIAGTVATLARRPLKKNK